jgi:hypothetical protein
MTACDRITNQGPARSAGTPTRGKPYEEKYP